MNLLMKARGLSWRATARCHEDTLHEGERNARWPRRAASELLWEPKREAQDGTVSRYINCTAREDVSKSGEQPAGHTFLIMRRPAGTEA